LSQQASRRPLIVPIFIPNEGCPHRCVFCDQVKVTDQGLRTVDPSTVKNALDLALQSPRYDRAKNPEIAFYGGTFTGLPAARMRALLEAGAPYLREGFFKSIRVSTRPDAVDQDRLDLLWQYGVRAVELGAQSMDDDVLRLTRRGHSAEDTIRSSYLLKRHGFKVGIQLMPGLPGDTEERFMTTVEKVVALCPDMVRLYPTVVIRGTVLAHWFSQKRYRPLQVKEAVRICEKSCMRLEGEGIPVIRIGLMSSPSLMREGEIVAGPWHAAFGFLVRSEMYRRQIEPFLPKPGDAPAVRLRVPPREIALLRGYRNEGLRKIENKMGARVAAVLPDEGLPAGKIEVDRV
jgi:histone acetyltransferase (RNA polymerase elongator complex component)